MNLPSAVDNAAIKFDVSCEILGRVWTHKRDLSAKPETKFFQRPVKRKENSVIHDNVKGSESNFKWCKPYSDVVRK